MPKSAALAFALSMAGAVAANVLPSDAEGSAGKSAFDFTFDRIEGGEMQLSEYRGNVLLVVNTASLCGFTNQYSGLQSVWERYRDDGLIVIGVPSNDFGNQEPGTENEIKHFCEVNFDIDFPMTKKVSVRGNDAHAFYDWAKRALGTANAPSWNFHKYLVGRDGQLIDAYPSQIAPETHRVRRAIEAALNASS
ncbi:MAG: glutathione peroxidase [Pseudomonadota bacterium]